MEKLEEAVILKETMDKFDLAKRYLDPIHQKFNQQEELYRSYIDPTNYKHSARVFDPRVFRVIETITPRMVANEPTGSFYPRESGDVVVTEVLNTLIKYDWKAANMFPKLVAFVKSMLIFGTAFGRVYWDYQEAKKARMVPTEVNGRMVWSPLNKEYIDVVVADHPNFEPLNIYDCFFDPNATSIDNMRWFIYRTFRTLDELKKENETRGYEHYMNLDRLETALSSKNTGGTTLGGGDASNLYYREHRRTMLSTQEFRGKDESNPEVVVLKCFMKDRWYDIAPEYGIVLRETENPYFHGQLPIIYGVDYPYPGDLLGMGEIEPIERIQRAINAVLNQRLDNVQLTLKNMWKVRKGGGVDMHTLVSAPGNIITVGDMGAVEPLSVPDVTGATFVQTMNYLTASLQNGSGITDYTMGINTSANTANSTATGTRLIQQEANAQFKLKIQLFNHMVVERIANQFKDLRIQYTTDKQLLRIVGSEEIDYLLDNTELAKTSLDGEQVAPGDFETPTKLQATKGAGFAFLTLMPEDIQPSVVGEYDFISTVSSDQLNDPIALQENFFLGVDRVSNPVWVEGLASKGKTLNYEYLTEKIFDKLQLGLDGKKVLMDLAPDKDQEKMSEDITPEQEQELGVTDLEPALTENMDGMESSLVGRGNDTPLEVVPNMLQGEESQNE